MTPSARFLATFASSAPKIRENRDPWAGSAVERASMVGPRALASAETLAARPIKLPTPQEMIRIVLDFERRLMADVARGREQLRRFFRDGRIDLIPQPSGFYVARSAILPLVLLTKPPPEEVLGGRIEISRYSASSCAGRI
jgi:hypothetical protein